LLYGSATDTWGKLAKGAAYKALIMDASATNVEWNAIPLNQSAAVSGALGATNGGTGQSTYTLGDTLYSSAADTLAKLAGNTTTTKKFLVQTGTGAASAAPVWGTVDGADVSGNISGNAGSATVLATARNINGVAFNGSAAISVNTNNAVTFNDGGAGGATGSTFNGGSVLTVSYNTIGAPSATGAGASGTWSINVTGSAASATTATTANALATGNNYQVNSLGVGTASSGTGGEIRATNNVTAYYSSDIKFKENVRVIPDALATVSAIGGKLFDWTDEYIESKGGEDGYFVQKSDFGVVAQDVQAVFPMAVRTREDGSLAVDYAKLGVLAFAALTELAKRVEALEAKG
jgi:hypothetical protein